MQTIAITSNWQVHIPRDVRNILGLEKPGQADIHVENDKIVIKPRSSGVLALAGKYKNRHKKSGVDIDNVRDLINYGDI